MSNRILGGRYEIQEKIGEGGMAVVHKAKCRLLNRNVALKILKPEFVNDTKIVESFRRESQSAASLTHPNIVNVYDVGKEGNIYYIVMEYIEGESLSKIINREGALDPDRAVSIAKQVAAALGHAHKNHIIHRDVKPHNIMITDEGVAKITDFGIAKAVNSETIINSTSVMGSVHYFSPEQARGGYIDEKSDIYSLGIVLYEMVTGKTPFDADNPVAVAMMHINDAMTPPSVINPRVPMYIENVIMKATEKYQTNRYKSAAEMYEALDGQDAAGIISNYFGGGERSDTRVMPVLGGGNAANGQSQMQEWDKENSRYAQREAPYDNGGRDGGADDNIPSKKKSGSMIITIGKKKIKVDKIKVSAILLAIIAAIFLSRGFFYFKDAMVSKEIQTPYMIGMTYEDAEKKVEELGLTLPPLEEVELRFSDEYKEGEIMEQDPEADAKVKKGYTIKIVISKGKDESAVPSLYGKTLDEAVALLKEKDFEKGNVTEENNDLPIGIVISQNPETGTALEKGGKVDLVLSKGKVLEKVTVPSLIGKNIDAAKNEIEAAGLSLGGDREYDYNNSYGLNIVYYQSIEPNQKVDAGTPINLKISKGPGTSSTMKPFNLQLDYTQAENDLFMIRIYRMQNGIVDLVHEAPHTKSKNGEIIPIEGSGKAKITVHFDDKIVVERNVDFEKGQFID